METMADVDALQRELASVQTALAELRRTVDGHEYGRRLRARLDHLLPPDAAVLVAAKGDDHLLDLGARRAAHFPQALDGQYPGSYPSDDVAAIAHLEALRAEGFDTLVVPAFSGWWLDHYAGLRSHMDTHYALLTSDDLCTIVDLHRHGTARPPSAAAQVLHAVQAVERQLEREPTMLDWRSGLNIRDLCPEYPVATAAAPSALPHFDRSVDIVVTADGNSALLAEARRVADTAVIVVGMDGTAVETQWLVSPVPIDSPSALRPADAAAAGAAMTVPGPDGGTLLIWMARGLTLLPGWLGPISRIFERDPATGAVGGRIVDFTGRLLHAGGVVLADGSLVSLGEGDWRPGDARYGFVREVDFCSSWFMVAMRRAVDETGGFDETLPAGPLRDADFGLRLRNRGYSVYVHPESTAVCSRTMTALLRTSPRAADGRRRTRTFAERWKQTLRSRSAFVDTWGTSATSRLPLTNPR